LIVLVLAPAAFGTVERWSLALAEVLVLAALSFSLYGKRREEYSLAAIPGLLPFALFLGFILLQLAPLPVGLVSVVSPGAIDIYGETLGVTQALGTVPLSLGRKATVLELFRFASYGAFYLLTVQLLSDRALLRKTVIVVAGAAGLLAFLALMQSRVSPRELLFFMNVPSGSRPFGSYVNRNHYANLMGMLFPLAFALFLFYRPRLGGSGWRARIAALLSRDDTNAHVLLGLASVLTAVSLVLSRSRGGIVSFVLVFAFFFLFLPWKAGAWKRLLPALLFLAVSGAAVSRFGWSPVVERFEKVTLSGWESSLLRPVIWNDIVHLAGDFPITGSGFGTLADVYPKYQSISGPGTLVHAHSDYLELLAGGGVVGAALFAWFVVSVLRWSFRRQAGRKNRYGRVLTAGCAVGVTFFLVHGFFDSSLHVGANGLCFFFLLGLAVSLSGRGSAEAEDAPPRRTRTAAPLRRLVPSVTLLVACFLVSGGAAVGEILFRPVKDMGSGKDRPREMVERAVRRLGLSAAFDPLEGRYHHLLGRIKRARGEGGDALVHLKRAVRLNPARGEYSQRLALLLVDQGAVEKADRLFRSGVVLDRRDPVPYRVYGSWLLSRGERARGVGLLKEAVSLEPMETEKYLTTLVIYGLSDDEMRQALPEMPTPLFLYARYLERLGKDSAAEEAYLQALDSMRGDARKNPSYFYRVHRFYLEREREEKALNVLRRGVDRIPGDPGLRLSLAGLFERQGRTGDAVEEYGRVLRIRPENRRAKERLQALRGGEADR
jgi:tetratricopeptide (TPR) repeat protein